MSTTAPEYERNVLYRSSLTGEFFFAPKVRVLGPRVRIVVGKKYNVTDAVQPFLLKKFRQPARRTASNPARTDKPSKPK